MNMKALLVIALLVILPIQQDIYKWGRPTSKGVDEYIKRNEYQLVIDYQEFIGDTLIYEPFLSTDDLSKYYNYIQGDMGYFERPDNIIISNEPRYIDYELSRLSEYERNRYRDATQFVRAVVMHELTHCYFHQIVMISQYDKKLEYEFQQGLRMIPVSNYSAEFIEEGICEYVVEMMNEMICSDEKLVLNKNDLSLNNRNKQRVKYAYSRQYVKPIVQEFGLKAAIHIIVINKPPSDEEILYPELYYQRLKWN